jgi:energy-coupling factor transporter ATP-binding protein EcfA2
MRLVWFTVHGYKRFEEPTEIHLDGDLIAICGPNEAGKSSLLGALTHLSANKAFQGNELTRRTTVPNDQNIIRARYLLEDADRAVLSGLKGGDKVRWLLVLKEPNGTFYTDIEPALEREMKPRKDGVAELKSLQAVVAGAGEIERVPAEKGKPAIEPLTAAEIDNLLKLFGSDKEKLGDTVINQLRTVTTKLEVYADAYGPDGQRVLGILGPLVDIEASHPNDIARGRIFGRRPAMLLFDHDARTLRSTYDVVKDIPGQSPTSAISNLASLAGLDLSKLTAAVTAEDHGLVDSLTRRANERLTERFTVSWRQSTIEIRFRVDATVLRILIESPHESAASSIADRSEGMRAFIALRAYTAVNSGEGVRPILLIDEAETHLHYQAQADLVTVMTEQDAASQVFYTTHSAGCLPEDLGTGVRLVAPIRDTERSRIINWFWEDDKPGFRSLLAGMGFAARALAFTPAQFAVFAEGPTELMLLPALLRDATGRRSLDFQVAPGLALVNRKSASALELEAARVAYVVDSDKSGQEISAVLRDGGVSDADIFTLRDGQIEQLTIEDFIDAEAYRRAVNEELRRSGHEQHQLVVGELPDTGRTTFVEQWAKKHGIGAPRKVSVASRVVELRRELPLTSGRRRQALSELYDRLRDALGVDQAVDAGWLEP